MNPRAEAQLSPALNAHFCRFCVLTLQGEYKFSRQCYGAYGDLGTAAAPPLLTRSIYKQRADEFNRLTARFAVMGVSKEAGKERLRESCKQVVGKSALCRLEYFDIVEHTLLDMMHLVQGVVGAHLVPLVKGKRIATAVTTILNEKSKKKIEDEDPPVAPPPPRVARAAPVVPRPPLAPLPRVFVFHTTDVVGLSRHHADGLLRRALRPEEVAAIAIHEGFPPEVQESRVKFNTQYEIVLNSAPGPAAASASAAASNSSPAAAAAAPASAAASSTRSAAPKRARDLPMTEGAAASASSSSAASSSKRARQVEPAAPTAAAAAATANSTTAAPAAAAAASAAPAAAAAAAGAAGVPPWKWTLNRDLHRLREHQKRFPTMTDADLQRLESAYRRIRAPLHIAPASKMPFQKSG